MNLYLKIIQAVEMTMARVKTDHKCSKNVHLLSNTSITIVFKKIVNFCDTIKPLLSGSRIYGTFVMCACVIVQKLSM